jgi:hypothetical protein
LKKLKTWWFTLIEQKQQKVSKLSISLGIVLFLSLSSLSFAQSVGTSPSLRDAGFEQNVSPASRGVLSKKASNDTLPLQQRIQPYNLSEGIPYSPVKEFVKNPRLTPELNLAKMDEDLRPFGPPQAQPTGLAGEMNLKYDVNLLPVDPQGSKVSTNPHLEKTVTPDEAASQAVKDEIAVSPFLKWVEMQKQSMMDKPQATTNIQQTGPSEDEKLAMEKQSILEDLYLKIRFPYLGTTPEPTTTTTGRGSVTYSTPDNSPPPPPKKQ